MKYSLPLFNGYSVDCFGRITVKSEVISFKNYQWNYGSIKYWREVHFLN